MGDSYDELMKEFLRMDPKTYSHPNSNVVSTPAQKISTMDDHSPSLKQLPRVDLAKYLNVPVTPRTFEDYEEIIPDNNNASSNLTAELQELEKKQKETE